MYLTPSINYAAHPRYSRVNATNDGYFQVVLEVRVRNSLLTSTQCRRFRETLSVGETHMIDPNWKNTDMELAVFSDAQYLTADDGLVVTGIMVRKALEDPVDLESSRWWLEWPLAKYISAKKDDIKKDDAIQARPGLDTVKALKAHEAREWIKKYYYIHR